MTDHDFMLKDLASYLVLGMTNEDHKNISVRIAGLWAKGFSLRPHDYEAGVHSVQ
jgi:hypothetical protein